MQTVEKGCFRREGNDRCRNKANNTHAKQTPFFKHSAKIGIKNPDSGGYNPESGSAQKKRVTFSQCGL